jgi:hypothetical protein
MNKEQFIYWLKGFTKAVNEEGPTPKQWETIVSELDKIKDCPDYSSPIDLSNPFPRWQEPHYVNPWDKHKVTCEGNPYKAGKTDTKVTYGNGTASSNGVIVTDGFIQNLSVTRAQPPFTLTTTSTAYGHISGSTVSYTANQLELDLE